VAAIGTFAGQLGYIIGVDGPQLETLPAPGPHQFWSFRGDNNMS